MNINFQTQIVDNFFENPDYVRALGLEATKTQKPFGNNGYLRGKRSEHLRTVDKLIYKKIVTSLGYLYLNVNFKEEYFEDISSTCEFQLTDGTWTEGWIHYDNSLITSVIYLHPSPAPDSGTKIFLPKKQNTIQLHAEYHKKTNADSSLRGTEEYIAKRAENNEQFYETVSIQNVYNRMTSFFGYQWHCGSNHFGDQESNSRLTIVTQIYNFGQSLKITS